MSLADGKIGSLKTLVQMLKSFFDVYNIDVRFGEEFVWDNTVKLPCVVVAPLGGQWEQTGNYREASQYQNNTWMTSEDIQVYCWSAAVDSNGRELDTATAVDHADAVELYATVLEDAPAGPWRMVGIDPEGCDLLLEGEALRIPFAAPIATPAEARAELVRLANEARGRGERDQA